MSFSREQQYAYEQFLLGENLFVTGPGGSGKSFLIQKMVQSLIARGLAFQVCALTGCAAVLLGNGAKTLHSWTGMGLAKGHKEDIVKKIVHNKKTSSSLRKTRVLIVDEISMLSLKLFEALNSALKVIKKNQAAFGGIQVIFTGDFYQLPPVGDDEEFCFLSKEWLQVFEWKNHIELKHIFRQEDDVYKRILNQIRIGELDEESTRILRGCVGKPVIDNIIPTKLFAVRSKTDFVNNLMYEKLEGEEIVYPVQMRRDLKTYMDSGKIIDPVSFAKCKALSPIEISAEIETLTNQVSRGTLGLKRGARVMCVHNISIEDGICNGSQGVVVDFMPNSVKTPIVLFSNGRRMEIEPIWTQSDEYPSIGIGQIPLCLAWAMTIHKIQGATLTMAEMDLGLSVFEYGQSYVALSRIRSLEGLYLSAFHPKKIKANPLVRQFYAQIPTDLPEIVSGDCQLGLSIKENIFEEYRMVSDDGVASDVKIVRL
jgi:ATP-dependent DNA helicase PIF1